jgi:16S rRNA (uracil1498-N3)-methyltransferase
VHRFFLPPEYIVEDNVTLPADVASQLSRVLRARVGDEIVVLDDTGMEYLVKLGAIDRDSASGTVISKSQSQGEPSVAITLYQGILKADRFEYVLQKGSELGLTSFVPMNCHRTISQNRPSPSRYTRWRKIITEAAEQSGRGRLPVLHEVIDFDSACEKATGVSLIPWEEERATSLKSSLTEWASAADATSSINILIGPEGGFTADEVELAKKNGITPVTLGRRILRAETAGLVTATAVLYELGELGG